MRKAILISVAMIAVSLGTSLDADAAVCGSNSCGASTTSIAVTGSTFGLEVTAASGAGVTGTVTGGYPAIWGATSGAGAAVEGDSTSGAWAVVGSNSSTGGGVWGVTSAGTGEYGVEGGNSGTGGYGVYGYSTAGYAVYGIDSSSGDGVYGTSSTGDGVHGQATQTTNSGVSGKNTGGGYGVYGNITGSSGGYAVYGNDGTTGGTAYAGYFNGDVDIQGCLKFGGTTYHGTCASSDRRLKQNIATMTGALDTVAKLRGVTFEWKDPTQHDNQTGPQRGFIAQEVETLFPTWVGEDKRGFKTLNIPDRELAALQVEAIKTLKAKNDALEQRVKDLEEARRPVIAYNPNWGIFAAGLVIGGVLLVNGRRKPKGGSAPA